MNNKSQESAGEPLKPLQIRIPESQKNEIKAYAASRGVSINKLLVDAYKLYKKQNK